MATQTGDALSFVDVQLEASDDAFATNIWDFSGFTNAIEISGGDRKFGEVYTAVGEFAIVTRGKLESLQVKIMIVYTEGATDPYERLRAAYEAGSDFYLRWSPKGGTGGDFEFTTDVGFLGQPIYPQGNVESGDPVVIEATLYTKRITKAVHA